MGRVNYAIKGIMTKSFLEVIIMEVKKNVLNRNRNRNRNKEKKKKF